MLLAAVITLNLDDESAYQVNARQVQRWFKDTVEQADKPLFDDLHRQDVARPYTLSPLILPQHGYPAWLRITSLDARLSALLSDQILSALPSDGLVFDPRNNRARCTVQSVDLGAETRSPFASRQVDVHCPETWAGQVEYGQLITAVMQPERVPRWLKLHFHTGTSFRLNAPEGFKSNLPLPVPRYVFQSLLRQWEVLSPAPLLLKIAPFLEHYVGVSHHRIYTTRDSFAGGRKGHTVGFAGRVEFELAPRDKLPADMRQDWRHYVDVVRLLAAFSFYAGTGTGTSRGLGMTLPLG